MIKSVNLYKGEIMTTTDALRKQVQKYVALADEKSLRIVQAILEIEQENDWWDNMPDNVRKSVEIAIKESDEGQTLPHDEVMKMYKQWLKK